MLMVSTANKGRSKSPVGLIVCLIAILLVIVILVCVVLGNSGKAVPVVTDPEVGAGEIVINELMSLNDSAYFNENGECLDWIEIQNRSEKTVNVKNYGLSDDPAKPAQYVFPSVDLAPDECLVVFASGKESGAYTAQFALSSDGEELVLTDAHGNTIDYVAFPSSPSDQSYSRDGEDKWSFTAEITPGYPNDAEGREQYLASRAAEAAALEISEVCAANYTILPDKDGEYTDWVEITNKSDSAVQLSAFSLTDNLSKPRKWRLPEYSLEPGKCVLVYLSGKNTVTENEWHASFGLSSDGDTLYLMDVSARIADSVETGKMRPDTSLVRQENEWVPCSEPTPGYPNTDEGLADFRQSLSEKIASGVVLSEVMLGNAGVFTDMYDEASDWIELRNDTDQAISLAGFTLSDDPTKKDKWAFPDGTTIGAGESLMVVASGRDETDESGVLHTNFGLSTDESVVLCRADGAVTDVLHPQFEQVDQHTKISYGRSAADGKLQYMKTPTPGTANAEGLAKIAATPEVSVDGGVFTSDGFTVELTAPEGTTIHYTLDCTEPRESSKTYTEPITVSGNTVIRAKSYAADAVTGAERVATYIISDTNAMPMVSVVADPDSVFGSSGIYTNWSSKEEVPAHIELTEIDGTRGLDQGFGLRIFGAFSRANDAKSFAVMARAEYGNSKFSYKLFDKLPYTDYESFVLRNGASEWNISKIRDVLLTSLADDTTDLPVQKTRPSALYINGDFFGVYFITEKINAAYFNQHYGVSKDSVNLLVGNGAIQHGDNADYKELLQYVRSHDLSVQSNYDYVCTRMDVDNYMDYVICEMYVTNTDTGNIKCWMSEEYDGKWRWILYDLDWAFYFLERDGVAEYLNPNGHGVSDMFDTSLILGLMKNPGFKQQFLERFAYHINVTYAPERVIARIDEIVASMDPEMLHEKEVWSPNPERAYNAWLDKAEGLREFAKERPAICKQHIQEYFHLSNSEMAELFGE